MEAVGSICRRVLSSGQTVLIVVYSTFYSKAQEEGCFNAFLLCRAAMGPPSSMSQIHIVHKLPLPMQLEKWNFFFKILQFSKFVQGAVGLGASVVVTQ